MIDARKDFRPKLGTRNSIGSTMRLVFICCTILTVICLGVLVLSIVNNCFGYIVLTYQTDPASLTDKGSELASLDSTQLAKILNDNLTGSSIDHLNEVKPLEQRGKEELLKIVEEYITQPKITKSYSLFESIFSKAKIDAELKATLAEEADAGLAPSFLLFRSWLSIPFIANDLSQDPLSTGIRTGIIGSLFTILITIIIAFPIGICAAIYLEEYAKKNAINRFIQTNIYNLSGVPSIIYGMLGLAIFVRWMAPLTSGSAFGAAPEGDNGYTILSAGLTLAILILPIIIINAQEAIKAVPQSLRESSLALGATKWQTILYHVLPSSMDRILTGTVLAVSRAIGDTAPILLVGASTFVSQDPTGLFSRYTTLPIKIFDWTKKPELGFQNAAAAAIIVLIVLLLGLNLFAIVLRNRYRKNRSLA